MNVNSLDRDNHSSPGKGNSPTIIDTRGAKHYDSLKRGTKRTCVLRTVADERLLPASHEQIKFGPGDCNLTPSEEGSFMKTCGIFLEWSEKDPPFVRRLALLEPAGEVMVPSILFSEIAFRAFSRNSSSDRRFFCKKRVSLDRSR